MNSTEVPHERLYTSEIDRSVVFRADLRHVGGVWATTGAIHFRYWVRDDATDAHSRNTWSNATRDSDYFEQRNRYAVRGRLVERDSKKGRSSRRRRPARENFDNLRAGRGTGRLSGGFFPR